MLSGKRAFRGDSAADTMSAILKEDPPDLSMTNQNISPGVERIVRHCLEKNSEQRFHSAHDLAFDLTALSGLSAPGRPAAAENAFSGAGRRRLLLVGAAALALLAVAGAYVAGRRARRETAVPGKLSYSQLKFRHAPIFNAPFPPDGQTVFYRAATSATRACGAGATASRSASTPSSARTADWSAAWISRGRNPPSRKVTGASRDSPGPRTEKRFSAQAARTTATSPSTPSPSPGS